MKKIENLDIGHVKQGFDNNFKIKVSEVFDDVNVETDFPHRHNFYMVCLVLKGSGIHIIDFEKIEVKSNRLFFLKPEQVHFWNINPKSKLAIIQFSIDFLTRLFNFNCIPAINSPSGSYFDIAADKTTSYYEIFQKIESENNKKEFNSEKIIQAQIFILLAEIERLLNSDTTQKMKSNKYEIFNNFKKLLNNKYKEITSISGYAELLNITPNYLNIIVREITGNTANELMHNRIILEAKRLLIHKNTNIAQIAFELGFKDSSYFARFFKKSTGISPTEFRNDIYKMYQHPNN